MAGRTGADWPDNLQRFAALSRVARRCSGAARRAGRRTCVHAHDWQAGLAAAYLHFGGGTRPATVMTVHNLAFQGRFPAGLLGTLGLPAQAWGIDGVEYYGGIGTLKAGLLLSPTASRRCRRPMPRRSRRRRAGWAWTGCSAAAAATCKAS